MKHNEALELEIQHLTDLLVDKDNLIGDLNQQLTLMDSEILQLKASKTQLL